MSPPLSGSGAECSGRVHGGPSGTDRDGLGRRVHGLGRIGPRPRGLSDPIGSRLWRSGRIVRADAPEAPDSFRMIPRFPQNSRRVRGGTILPERHFRRPRPGSVTGPRPRRGGRRGRSDDPARSGTRGNLKDDVSPFTTPIHPPLRPFTLRYAPLPRTVKGQGAKQSKRGAADEPPGPESATPSGPARGAALDDIGSGAHGDAPVRRHRVRDDPGQCGQDDDPGQCGLDRGGVSRVWARAGPGVARGRRAPSPACVMRAQRDGFHPASRRASPARRNPPALDPRRLTSHNASLGDITKSTPPASPRRTPVDRPGDAGAGGRSRRRGRPAGTADGAPAAGAPPPLPDGPVPRQAEPSVAGRDWPSTPAAARVRRSPPGAGRPRPS